MRVTHAKLSIHFGQIFKGSYVWSQYVSCKTSTHNFNNLEINSKSYACENLGINGHTVAVQFSKPAATIECNLNLAPKIFTGIGASKLWRAYIRCWSWGTRTEHIVSRGLASRRIPDGLQPMLSESVWIWHAQLETKAARCIGDSGVYLLRSVEVKKASGLLDVIQSYFRQCITSIFAKGTHS